MTQLGQCNPLSIVQNAQPPTNEGNMVLPFIVDLNATPNFEIDLSQQYNSGKISSVQSVFVDNSLNVQQLLLTLNTNQQVKIPPQKQGYIRLLSQNPPKITGSSAGTVKIGLQFLNFPTDTFLWDMAGNLFTFTAGSELKVSDATLEGAVVANKFQDLLFVTGNNSVVKPDWGGDRVFNVSTAATGNTNIAAAPGANLGYFIKEINVRVTGQATLAAAGVLTVQITEGNGGTLIAQAKIFLNANGAAINTAPSFEVLHLVNMNYNMLVANTALVVNLSAALGAGTIDINVVGGITPIIGP